MTNFQVVSACFFYFLSFVIFSRPRGELVVCSYLRNTCQMNSFVHWWWNVLRSWFIFWYGDEPSVRTSVRTNKVFTNQEVSFTLRHLLTAKQRKVYTVLQFVKDFRGENTCIRADVKKTESEQVIQHEGATAKILL